MKLIFWIYSVNEIYGDDPRCFYMSGSSPRELIGVGGGMSWGGRLQGEDTRGEEKGK